MSIADIIPDEVFKLAIHLGVSIQIVLDLESKPHGGMSALHYWSAGKVGQLTPTTWKYLLDAITEVAGKEVAGRIKKDAQDPTWSKME